MQVFKNTQEFEKIFSKIVDNAIQYTMDKMLVEYKDIIQKVVYDVYKPKQYQRTMQFKKSWKVKNKKISNGSSGLLYQDKSEIRVNTGKFQHGNPVSGGLKDFLTDMIYEGYGYYFDQDNTQFPIWSKPRNAWNPLIEKLDKGLLDKWFKEGMAKQGVKIEGNLCWTSYTSNSEE